MRNFTMAIIFFKYWQFFISGYFTAYWRSGDKIRDLSKKIEIFRKSHLATLQCTMGCFIIEPLGK